MVRFKCTIEQQLHHRENGGKAGALEGTRTPDLRFRKPVVWGRLWRKTAVFCAVKSALLRLFVPR